MNVVALTYYKYSHTYKQIGRGNLVGLEGVEGEITYGTIEGELWYSLESPLRVYKTNESEGTVDLHIVVVPDLPDDVVVALVQSVGDDIVAVTPLAHIAPLQRLATRYLQIGGQA